MRNPCAIVPPNGVCAARVGIDVDELPVLGRLGEGVDPGLVDGDPVGDPNFLADASANLVERGDRHSGRRLRRMA